jgi:hypothetical protein
MVMTVGAPEVPGVTVGGLKVTVAPAGRPVADILTTLLKQPPNGGTVTFTTTAPPADTVTRGGTADTVKSAETVSVTTEDVEVAKLALPE